MNIYSICHRNELVSKVSITTGTCKLKTNTRGQARRVNKYIFLKWLFTQHPRTDAFTVHTTTLTENNTYHL